MGLGRVKTLSLRWRRPRAFGGFDANRRHWHLRVTSRLVAQVSARWPAPLEGGPPSFLAGPEWLRERAIKKRGRYYTWRLVVISPRDF
jgi:hypothetical protein